nr:Chain C, NP418 epitope from 1918 influenza strain [synthetic construct]
LPFERATIM